jgi:putative hydrolase of the HAD superfamily
VLARFIIGLRSSRAWTVLVRVKAVLLDALGTLVELHPPGPRLRAALLEHGGVDVGDEAAQRGFAAEIGHYLIHHMEGATPERLEVLRDDCARVMHEALGAQGLDRAAVRAAMLDALAFRVYEDVVPVLGELRERGLKLVVVSNWDCSLPLWLDDVGLLDLVDGAVSSAMVGQPKPAPAVFEEALSLVGVGAAEAVHVGDSPEGDVEGARAAGIRAVLVTRGAQAPPGVEFIPTLRDLPSLL